MRTWIKTSIATALAATVGLGATMALARGGDCDGPRGDRQATHYRMNPEDMQERAEQRLDKLRDALVIRADQQAAWEEFRGTLLGNAEKAAEHMKSMRDQERPATAVERMARMEEFGQARLESLQAARGAAEKLYAALDDNQKKTFDQQFRLFGGHGMGPGGRHGRMGPEGKERPGRS